MSDFFDYIKKATVEGKTEKVYCNGINYTFVAENDGWISIFGFYNGEHIPLIQACNKEKALDYIALIEPVEAPTQRLVDNQEHCICCGAEIPEGQQVCYKCKKEAEQ